MAASIPTLILDNGVEMPALGFGTYAKEEISGATYEAVIIALDTGYRHLDCAWYYRNEDEIGSALKEWLSRNSSANRSDIFVTTKVWPHLMEPEDIEWSLNSSLENLGLDYVDSFLLHWPIAFEKTEDNKVKLGEDGKYIVKKALTENLEPSWRTMEKLYKGRKTRSIGVSNWTIPGLQKLLSYATIKPSVNQVEIHPFLPNNALVDYCNSQSILPVAYSPLGSQHQCPTTGEKVLENAELNAVAEKKGVSLVQILIAWGMKRGYAVLPKSSTAARIKSNFEVVDLSGEEFEAVNKVSAGRHTRFIDLTDVFGYDIWPEERTE